MIALLGNLARDLLPGSPPRVGGGPYHGARALQRLRVPARIVARCAEADRETLLPPLVRLGTPVRYVAGATTATFGIAYDGDRRTMQVEAIGDSWTPQDVPVLPPAVRWVHVAPLARSDFPADTLAAIGTRRRLSLDGQGLVRASRLGPLELDADFDRSMLRHVWVLKLADEEADAVGDVASLPVREILVTHGSRGSTLYLGGRREEIPAWPIDADPTGAGDAFMTAYVAARDAGFAPAGAARSATAVVAALLGR
ncbi:MAG TPA: PfkB family carbohydrate kinase [Gaiellaceae bacterium]|nr:PfkB family carbohydrate kinase [Gaiellaceae bacterium]